MSDAVIKELRRLQGKGLIDQRFASAQSVTSGVILKSSAPRGRTQSGNFNSRSIA
jgi:hypothetical protein